jgi:hypothetical protein
MRNVEALEHCAALGIPQSAHMMIHPGSMQHSLQVDLIKSGWRQSKRRRHACEYPACKMFYVKQHCISQGFSQAIRFGYVNAALANVDDDRFSLP